MILARVCRFWRAVRATIYRHRLNLMDRPVQRLSSFLTIDFIAVAIR